MYGEFVNISPSFRREFFRTKGADPQTYLLYLQEGAFSLTVGGETRSVLPGTVVFFSPNTEMERHVLEPIRFLYIRFNGNPNHAFRTETTVFSISPIALYSYYLSLLSFVFLQSLYLSISCSTCSS